MHNLNTLAVDPLTLAPLPTGPQGADRLHPDWYDAADAATNPVFAWIPKVAKLPYDHNVVDGMVIAGLNLSNLTTNEDSIQYMWLIATSTLSTLNNGTSFHHQTTLFDIADLLIDGNNSPLVTERADRMYFTPNEIEPLLKGIHDEYQTIMHSVQSTIMGSIVAAGADIPATAVNPDPVVHRTETEFKQKKESDKRAELWRQFLACPTKDDNGNDTIYFPELDENFKEVLGASNVTEAIELLTRHSQNFTSMYQEILNQGIMGETTFRFGKHLSSALIRLIQQCDFNTSNLNSDPEAINNRMTGFAFLTPQEGTLPYNTIIGGCSNVMREVAVGVDSTKQQKMPSKLYIGGQASTHTDFVSMGANMILLFMLALKDPINDKPIISQMIEKLVRLTRSDGYKQSIKFHTNPETGNRYFIAHLINDATEMTAQFARTATSFELTTARKDNNTTKICAIYKQSSDFCERKLSKLKDHLDAADYNTFTTQPMYFQSLSPIPETGTRNWTGEANQRNDPASSPPRKKGKHDATPNYNNNNTPNNRNNSGSPNRNNGNSWNGNRSNNNTTPTNSSTAQLGIIKPVNKPANWRPKIPANITGCNNGDSTAKKICPAFILAGASCTFHPNCNLLHLSKRNFQTVLDPTSQNNFIDWVSTSTDVEWTNPNSAPQRNG